MRLCAAPAWGAAGALTDTSQTWRAPVYSARRPRGCRTRRSLAGSPASVSARVAFTATTAAALRVNATCAARPSRLCDAMRQPNAPAHCEGMRPGCRSRVSLTTSGELSTELIPGGISHMRNSDHASSTGIVKAAVSDPFGANRFYSSSPQPPSFFSRHTTQGTPDRAAAATACTLAKACEPGCCTHLGALLLGVLARELYHHCLLGGLAVQHQERGAARLCRQRSAAGLLTWQPYIDPAQDASHLPSSSHPWLM